MRRATPAPPAVDPRAVVTVDVPRPPGRWRTVGWTLTATWAGFWAVVAAVDVVSPDGGPTDFLLLLLIGGAPVAPLWGTWIAQYRRRRTHVRTARQAQEQHRRLEERGRRLRALPQPVRGDWLRLEHAIDLARGLVEHGWVDGHAVSTAADRVAHLERLLAADSASDRLGGRPSAEVRRQVTELTDLLVALADTAVERQAVGGRDLAPATLRDAQDQLEAERRAHLELAAPAPPRGPRWRSRRTGR